MPRFALVLFPMFAILARDGETTVGQQPDRRLLAAALWDCSPCSLQIGIGLLDSISSIAGRRGVRQFVKFGIVGASGFIVNLVVFTLLQRLDPLHNETLHYNVLYSISFLAGGVSNYWLNRIWTFRSTGHAVREGAQFLTVSVIALVVGLVVSAARRAVPRPRPPHVVHRDRRRYLRQFLREQVLDV